mmetsp:Transcript_22268/g.61859  ORF Transcript_22268/g.61859 Transcript_22268/m.61859 type:complete len:106 (+) Transcript_22268:934-1251(+)
MGTVDGGSFVGGGPVGDTVGEAVGGANGETVGRAEGETVGEAVGWIVDGVPGIIGEDVGATETGESSLAKGSPRRYKMGLAELGTATSVYMGDASSKMEKSITCV